MKIKKHKSKVNIRKLKEFKEKGSIVKERICEFLELPYELIGDTTKITLLDNKYIYVEGKSSVEEYYDNYIKFRTVKYTVHIDGINMTIKEFGKHEIVIEGVIRGVSYENK